MSYLNSGRLNLSLLRDIARTDLFTLLDSIDGTKCMVWDPKLALPLGLISDYSSIKEHKVIQMLQLRPGPLPIINAENLVYFIRPELSHIDTIAENVKLEMSKKNVNFNFHIIFMNRKCILCEKKLEALGVFGDFISINEYSPDFYVWDSDLISIEWPQSFKECHLEMDYSSLYQLARSLMTLQCAFGIIPVVYGIGRLSKIVYDIMNKMKSELIGIEAHVISNIDQLIIIDRSIDLLSPTIFQLTYEGLLDEIYGINQTTIRLPPEKFLMNENAAQSSSSNPQQSHSIEPPTEMKRFYLNSDDELFKKLRDLFYLSVGPALRVSTKNLSAQFDERRTAKTVREIKQFVEKIPYLQKLRNQQANHISMAELIREFTDREEFHEMLFCENELLNCFETDSINGYIETCISRSVDIITVLRLIAIQSFCANGLKQKTIDFYKREILQTYGYEHMLTLIALEKASIIRISNGYGLSYSGLRTRFKLTRNENESKNSSAQSSSANNEDVHQGFIHDVHVPLSTRIVQHIDQFGFRSFADAFSRNVKYESNQNNPYVLFEEYQSTTNNQQNSSSGRRRRNSDCTSIQSSSETNDKLVLVLFVGGCTFSEVSSLRILSRKEGLNSDYLIATTSIINGKTFLRSLVETLN